MRVVALIRIAVELLADAACLAILLFRPTQSIEAENLFLRRQLALFKERGVRPRRIDAANSNQLGAPRKTLRMAGCTRCSTAEDDDSMAPRRVAIVLAMEVPTWPAQDSRRVTCADP